MKKLFLFAGIAFFGLPLMPQVVEAQGRSRPHIEIEVDPLAYILNGYSLHTALAYPKMRFNLGVVGLKQPDFFLDNDAFTVYTTELDLKADYLFGKTKGWFAGLQFTYGKDRIGLKEDNYRENVWGATIGIRGGYRIMVGKANSQYKGFYISPWLAWLYTPVARTIKRKGETYTQPRWFPFPAIHLGWRF